MPETHHPGKLVPSLDTKEVSSLFNLPFEQFLRSSGSEAGVQDWRHSSRKINWLGSQWIFHDFFATVTALVKPDGEADPLSTRIFTRIWGLTARILVEACVVGYGRMPEFEHTTDLWDAGKIEAMIKFDGRLKGIVGRREDESQRREFKL
jgi:hypothetical protein